MINTLQNPNDKNLRTRKLFMSKFTLDNDGNPTNTPNRYHILADKWKYLIDAPFKISNKCCDILKKQPLHEYEKNSKKRPIVGTMAYESSLREKSYLQSGCNIFTKGNEKCNPLGFWTEQDILEYIVTHKLQYASVYGDIIKDENNKWVTTGEKRTGCIFCMYGIQFEKDNNRFQRLELSHPQLHDYCMNKLGFKQVCEYMNIPYENKKE